MPQKEVTFWITAIIALPAILAGVDALVGGRIEQLVKHNRRTRNAKLAKEAKTAQYTSRIYKH